MKPKNNIVSKSLHILITMLPFAIVYFISPHIKYQSYEFLYLVSQRKFWYMWIIPVLLIISNKYKWTYIFTSCTTASMIAAQLGGDILLLKIQQGSYYHANHFGLWIKYTLILYLICICINLMVKHKKVKYRIKSFYEWYNCK